MGGEAEWRYGADGCLVITAFGYRAVVTVTIRCSHRRHARPLWWKTYHRAECRHASASDEMVVYHGSTHYVNTLLIRRDAIIT